MPVVKGNLQWWMVEIFNGFGSYLNNLSSLKKRVDTKTLSLKEEGDSLSYNEAYNREVVKSDKTIQCMNLSYLCTDCFYNKSIIDQWKLVWCCGIAAVRHTTNNPQLWAGSFRAVNLHLKYNIPFEDWCKKLIVLGYSKYINY